MRESKRSKGGGGVRIINQRGLREGKKGERRPQRGVEGAEEGDLKGRPETE